MITDMEKLKIILYDFWLIDTGTCTFLRLSLHSVTLLTAETRNEIIQYTYIIPWNLLLRIHNERFFLELDSRI